MREPEARNIHAVGLVIETTGVLIGGPSGVGKTTLALALLAHCSAHGRFARLVADDQLFVGPVRGRLLASAPSSIAGLAEASGFGPAPVPALRRMVVDLMVELVVDAGAALRMAPQEPLLIEGVALPRLVLPGRNTPGCVLAVAARCGVSPFRARAMGDADAAI